MRIKVLWLSAALSCVFFSLFATPRAVVFDFGGVMCDVWRDGAPLNNYEFNTEMYELIAELKQHHLKVALLSNVSSKSAFIFDTFGYYDIFDLCILSCDIGMYKPDLNVFKHLLDNLETPAENVVFIDDKRINVKNASELGIDAILFTSASEMRQELISRGLLFLNK